MKQSKLKRIIIGGALAVSSLLLTTQASALTLGWGQYGGFKLGTATSDCDFGSIACTTTVGEPGVEFYEAAANPFGIAPWSPHIDDTYTTIGWGNLGSNTSLNGVTGTDPFTNASRSALKLDTFSGTLDSDGTWVTISTIFHKNTPINHPILTGVDIHTALTFFYPNISVPGGDIFAVDPTHDEITFLETVNSAPCNEDGSTNPLGTECDDRFAFDTAIFNPVPFTLDGQNYKLFFKFGNPIGSVADGSFLYTGESATGQISIVMSLREVSEPATLALMGLGLLGLGFAGRKKKSS